MSEVIETLESFLKDEAAWEMFVTGKAGTGKTHSLAKVVSYCNEHSISYLVCAFTHKACGVLEEKLPKGANISTLHSYLNKRPGINEQATHKKHVDIRMRMAESERFELVIIDEFSMVGESDYMDLVEMQDPHDETQTEFIKTLYVGDPYQLPPVGDMQTIIPRGKYWIQLLTVHRTDRDDLLSAMIRLTDMIDGADLEPLGSSENLIRGQDLVKSYTSSTSTDKVCLAWTNEAVENLNAAIAKRKDPVEGDAVWCPTLRHNLTFSLLDIRPSNILTATGQLTLNTKYKTLEFLLDQPEIKFGAFYNETLDEPCNLAYVFGHYQYKKLIDKLTSQAVAINSEISRLTNVTPSQWARANANNPIAINRAKAWRKLLAIKEGVVCIDFPYAMTIHKSQGSTYEEIYLDSEDLSKCGNFDTEVYLKLFYVAISRASKKVITN